MTLLQDIMGVDQDQLTTESDNGQTSFPSQVCPRLLGCPSQEDQLFCSAQSPGFKDSQPSHAYNFSATASSSGLGQRHDCCWPITIVSDPMEPSGVPGHHCFSFSSGDYHHPDTPMGSFSSMSRGSTSAPSVPVKLTPITGRVSRAKKGVPVHTCNQCRPPKTFTRAEHLRRHQLSHDKPRYVCCVNGCERSFHRKDLLERHLQRHESEGDHVSRTGSPAEDQRPSANSIDEQQFDTTNLTYFSATSPVEMDMAAGMPSTSPFQSLGGTAGTSESLSSPVGEPVGGMGLGFLSPAGQQYHNNSYAVSPETRPAQMLPHEATSSFGASSMAAPTFSSANLRQRRTTPEFSPLYVETQGLCDPQVQGSDGLPGLSHGYEPAGWPSSASDSAFSTPSDNTRAFWPPAQHSSEDWQNSSCPYTYHDAAGGLETINMAGSLYFPFVASPPLGSAPIFTSAFDMPPPNICEDPVPLGPQQPQHSYPGGVRGPTPPPTLASTGSFDVMASPSSVLPSNEIINSMACVGRQKDLTIGLMASPPLTRTSLPQPPASAWKYTAQYVEVYWEKFHEKFPIVHKGQFEAAVDQSRLLRCAMAAIATQYLSDKEHRFRGQQLHEWAWREAKRVSIDEDSDLNITSEANSLTRASQSSHWDVNVMQAILLCEMFARFRGRKATVRPSKLFQSLYERVGHPHSPFFIVSSNSSLPNATSLISLSQVLERPTMPRTVPVSGSNSVRWHTWLDQEARRRLLAGCFVLDVHSSIYQEQQRVRDYDVVAEGVPPIPLTGPTSDMWDAASADAWAATAQTRQGCSGASLALLDMDSLAGASVEACAPFDRAVILAGEALRLQSNRTTPTQHLVTFGAQAAETAVTARIASLFPDCPVANTYLALHHTPLHDLMAVSGEKRIFGREIASETTFTEKKQRLRHWVVSPDAAAAVGFACRALRSFAALGRHDVTDPDKAAHGDDDDDAEADAIMDWEESPPRPPARNDDLSDYWGMYVCALICWAFAQRAPPSKDCPGNEAVLAWVLGVASTATADAPRLRPRAEARAVAGVVRTWLEAGCAGGRNQLQVEAVGVLKRLEDADLNMF